MNKPILIALALSLTGCAGIANDQAIGTMKIPGENDCQFRRFEGAGGGGFGANLNGSVKTLTVTGPKRCVDADTLKALEGFL